MCSSDLSTFVWPNLTTVDLPRVQMGRMSVDTLLDALETGDLSTRPAIELPVELVVRQSSGVVGTSQGESAGGEKVEAAQAVSETASER